MYVYFCAPLTTLATRVLPLLALLLRFQSPEDLIVLPDLLRPLWFCRTVISPTTGSVLALRLCTSLPKHALAAGAALAFIQLHNNGNVACDSQLRFLHPIF